MCLTFFFFNDTATTEIYTLSLHDALPILKFPEHSKESPQFSGSCQLNGHDLPGFAIGVLRNEEGAAILQALSAWRIDEKQKKFVPLPTDELRCSRDGIITGDGGR